MAKEPQVSEHISVEELADQAEQLLDPARTDAVRAHLTACPICAETSELLASVTTTLAAEPVPAMPPDVVARLDGVLAEEQARRAGQALPPGTPLPPLAGGSTASAGRPSTSRRRHDRGRLDRGRLDRDWLDRGRPERPRRGRAAAWVLAAAVLATAVGFGGYVLSARAGLNEPPAGSAALSSNALKQQANALENTGTVDAHRFSHAWSCAREVTDGRIAGLASVTVDGSPALLIYLRADGQDQAVLVQGCEADQPHVVDTIPLSR
jgi:hypothetical protein